MKDCYREGIFAKRVVNFSQTEDRKNSGKVKDEKAVWALFFIVDQSVLDCIAHKMSDVVNPELMHDIGSVGIDRSGTDEQLLSSAQSPALLSSDCRMSRLARLHHIEKDWSFYALRVTHHA